MVGGGAGIIEEETRCDLSGLSDPPSAKLRKMAAT